MIISINKSNNLTMTILSILQIPIFLAQRIKTGLFDLYYINIQSITIVKVKL